jgi:hypothetical protein
MIDASRDANQGLIEVVAVAGSIVAAIATAETGRIYEGPTLTGSKVEPGLCHFASGVD